MGKRGMQPLEAMGAHGMNPDELKLKFDGKNRRVANYQMPPSFDKPLPVHGHARGHGHDYFTVSTKQAMSMARTAVNAKFRDMWGAQSAPARASARCGAHPQCLPCAPCTAQATASRVLHLDRISTVSRPHLGRISIASRPQVGRLPERGHGQRRPARQEGHAPRAAHVERPRRRGGHRRHLRPLRRRRRRRHRLRGVRRRAKQQSHTRTILQPPEPHTRRSSSNPSVHRRLVHHTEIPALCECALQVLARDTVAPAAMRKPKEEISDWEVAAFSKSVQQEVTANFERAKLRAAHTHARTPCTASRARTHTHRAQGTLPVRSARRAPLKPLPLWSTHIAARCARAAGLKDAFRAIDKDGNGVLSKKEMRQALQEWEVGANATRTGHNRRRCAAQCTADMVRARVRPARAGGRERQGAQEAAQQALSEARHRQEPQARLTGPPTIRPPPVHSSTVLGAPRSPSLLCVRAAGSTTTNSSRGSRRIRRRGRPSSSGERRSQYRGGWRAFCALWGVHGGGEGSGGIGGRLARADAREWRWGGARVHASGGRGEREGSGSGGRRATRRACACL